MSKRKVINTKMSPRDSNCEEGDLCDCDYCGKLIGYNGIETEKGMVHDRRHRVDVTDRNVTSSYHLPCYDLHVLGYIRHSTVMKMIKFPCYKDFTYVIKRNGGRDIIKSQYIEVTYQRGYASRV